MSFLKNAYRLFLVLCLIVTGTKSSFASIMQDVPEGYWAENAVKDCINRGYLQLDAKHNFYPEGTIKRAAFLNSLLKVIESEDAVKGAKAYFKDVNRKSSYSNDIAVSQNIGIVFGYPDKTFKPDEAITRSEATSIVANISRVKMGDKSILEEFSDVGEIPGWAVDSYATAVSEKLYVNYPNPEKFNPKAKMTRAEAAVLFAKMAEDFDMLKLKYSLGDKDAFLRQETLSTYNKAPRTVVKIYNNKKVIEAGNVIKAHPTSLIDTRKIQKDSYVTFLSPEDMYTDEGTLLYKKGAKFNGRVHIVKNRIWINKQQKALFIFDNGKYPNDTEKELAAVPYTTNRGRIVFVTDANSKKKYKESSKELTKGDFLLQYVDKLRPVVKTKIKKNEDIYLLLTGDLIIPSNPDL